MHLVDEPTGHRRSLTEPGSLARVQSRQTNLETCATEGCGSPAVIPCRFRSLAIADVGQPARRSDREVGSAWCWPCFAVWTDRLKELSRRGWGLGD